MEWFNNKVIPVIYEPYIQYFNDVPKYILDYYNNYVFTEKKISYPLLNYMISEWLTYAFRNKNQGAACIYMYGWDNYGHYMFNDQVTTSIYMFYSYFNNGQEPHLIWGENCQPSFLVNLDAEI